MPPSGRSSGRRAATRSGGQDAPTWMRSYCPCNERQTGFDTLLRRWGAKQAFLAGFSGQEERSTFSLRLTKTRKASGARWWARVKLSCRPQTLYSLEMQNMEMYSSAAGSARGTARDANGKRSRPGFGFIGRLCLTAGRVHEISCKVIASIVRLLSCCCKCRLQGKPSCDKWMYALDTLKGTATVIAVIQMRVQVVFRSFCLVLMPYAIMPYRAKLAASGMASFPHALSSGWYPTIATQQYA